MPVDQAALASSSSRSVRGVPLITVLFMASVMLPLFLPPGMTFDKLLRALIGVALFASAYMAEVVRGGLQAIPKGQYEGGRRAWPRLLAEDAADHPAAGAEARHPGHRQHLHRPVQGHERWCSSSRLFDLLGIVQQNFSDANWATPQTPTTGLSSPRSCSGCSASACRVIRNLMERRLEHRPQTISKGYC